MAHGTGSGNNSRFSNPPVPLQPSASPSPSPLLSLRQSLAVAEARRGALQHVVAKQQQALDAASDAGVDVGAMLLATWRQEVFSLMVRRATVRLLLDERRARSQLVVAKLESDVADAQRSIDVLKTHQDKRLFEFDQLRAAVQSSHESLEEARRRERLTTARLDATRSSVDGAVRQLSTFAANRDVLFDQLERAQTLRLGELARRLDGAPDRVRRVRDSLTTKSEDIAAERSQLLAEMDAVKAQMTPPEAVEQLDHEVHSVEEQCAEVHQEKRAIGQHLAQLQHEADWRFGRMRHDYEAFFAEQRQAIDALRVRLESTSSEQSAAHRENVGLSHEAVECETSASHLAADADSLRRQLESERVRLTAAKEDELRRIELDSDQRLSAKADELAGFKKEHTKAQARLRQLERQLAIAEENAANDAKARKTHLEQKLSFKQQQLRRVAAERDRLQDTLRQLERMANVRSNGSSGETGYNGQTRSANRHAESVQPLSVDERPLPASVNAPGPTAARLHQLMTLTDALLQDSP